MRPRCRPLERAFMLALRDACRTDAGFDVHAFERWLDVYTWYPEARA